MQRSWLFAAAIGFCIGIALQSLARFTFFGLCIITSPLFFVGSVCLIRRKYTRISFLIGIAFACSVLGAFRFYLSDRVRGDPELDAKVGKKVELLGTVSEDIDKRDDRAKITLRLHDVSEPMYVLVSTERYVPYGYGDTLKIGGILEKPKAFTTDGGREFDYASYLAKENIFYEIRRADIELISSGSGSVVTRALLTLKSRVTKVIERDLPEPESGLLAGVLLGAKHALGSSLEKEFVRTGTIHIVALSGYNVTIVAEGIARLLSFLPRMAGGICSGLSIVLFAILTGGGATVMRATTMSLIALYARLRGKIVDIGSTIALALLIMLMQNPWILIYDASFQLSFLATIGLIYFTPLVYARLRVTNRFGFRELLSGTLGTQIFVLPFILYLTGIFSLVALPVNILIIPLTPTIMLFGFITVVAGLISPLLSFLLGVIAYLLLRFVLTLIHVADQLPFSSIQFHQLPIFVVFICYFFLGWLIWREGRRTKATLTVLPESLR